MPVLTNAARSAMMDALDDEVNAGVGTSQLRFETSGDVEVATIDLQDPAFGNAAAGVLTLQGVPLQDADATGGTVAQASIYDGDNNKVIEFTVGTGGAEIIITSTTIAANEKVDLTALTITLPAS